MRRALLVCLVPLAVACGGTVTTNAGSPGSGDDAGTHDASPQADGASNADGSTSAEASTTVDASKTEASTTDAYQPTCPGDPPMCADACGSDYFPANAECVGGTWECPPGTVDPKDCPPGTCWGMPLPGEVCGPSGWSCEPKIEQYLECPSLMCAVCEGFDGPTTIAGCQCTCVNGQVECAQVPLPECAGLDFCSCWDHPGCQYIEEDCICPCDYECPGHDPCDCGCGGGTYLGCEPIPG